MQQIDIQQAKAVLSDLIEAVNQGEEIIITKGNQPVAKLIPIIQDKPQPKFGSAKGLISMSDDFDEPLEDFNEYMK